MKYAQTLHVSTVFLLQVVVFQRQIKKSVVADEVWGGEEESGTKKYA
jgi:hypothetical protein